MDVDEFRVELTLLFKDGSVREVVFERVENLQVDYEHNKLSLFDLTVGMWYNYHFKEKGDEKDGVAVGIKDFRVIL